MFISFKSVGYLRQSPNSSSSSLHLVTNKNETLGEKLDISSNLNRSLDTKMPLINLVISEERKSFLKSTNPFLCESSVFSSSTRSSSYSNRSLSTLKSLKKSRNSNSKSTIQESPLIFDGIVVEK